MGKKSSAKKERNHSASSVEYTTAVRAGKLKLAQPQDVEDKRKKKKDKRRKRRPRKNANQVRKKMVFFIDELHR